MEVQAAPSVMMPSSSSATTAANILHTRLISVKTATSLMTIGPENDPHPSWTFFPASATYIPHPTYSTSPVSSPAAAPSSPPRHTSPQPAHATSNNPGNNTNNHRRNSTPTSTPSTHHRILDHCFHVSIETRLKQAEAQYLASTQEQAVEQQIKEQEAKHQTPMSALDQDDWRRRQRSLVDEAVVLGRKGSNVEAIVDGILRSHRSSGPLQNLPRHLKHRLHLCQLTSMVFGRFDVASSTNNSAGLNIYSAFHSRRHGASRAAIQRHLTNNPNGQKTRTFFAQPIQSSPYCRRHHRRDCQRTCCTLAKLQQQQQRALEQKKKMTNNYYMNNVRKPEQQRVAGLVDTIPAFLQCSAMSYTDIAKSMVEKGEAKDVAETRVLEGWYRLLLEMMTQAVVESFLCDGAMGVETILDVFSYGDEAETEDEPKQVAVEEKSGTAQQEQQNIAQESNGHEHQDDILFVKTPEYEAFKKAKDERLQEFLSMKGASMEQHFVKLAAKYPLIVFERQMTHYIARSQKLLEDPKLSRSAEEIGFLIPPATAAYADGSLSMPVSDDEDDEMEEISRLEEIKEEADEITVAAKNVEERPQRVRHEKMKLATITTSMDGEEEPAKLSEYEGQPRHLPSPPPSMHASRSSTVSPSTTSVSYNEEEESIAEAAMILMSNKKHRYPETVQGSKPYNEAVATEKLGRAVKKIKV